MAAFNALGTQTSFNDIQSYFLNISGAAGTNPISLNEYYRGGLYVPDITENNGVLTSGTNSVSTLQGKWGYKTFTTSITSGTYQYSEVGAKGETLTYYYRGYAGSGSPVNGTTFGSIGTSSYTTINGTITIYGIYRRRAYSSLSGWSPSLIYVRLSGFGTQGIRTIAKLSCGAGDYTTTLQYSLTTQIAVSDGGSVSTDTGQVDGTVTITYIG